MSQVNVYACLSNGFPENREETAIQIPNGASYSWDDIETTTARLANWLQKQGLQQGDRVAVQVEKSPEVFFLYLATLRAGYIFLPLNTAYRGSEVEYFLENASPALAICGDDTEEWFKPLAEAQGVKAVYTLNPDGTGSLMDAASGESENFETCMLSSDTPAAILYTSGTTGRSKGAVLTHGNLISNIEVLYTFWGWQGDDVLLHILPVFHAHGLFVAAQGALRAGAKMIWLAKFDPDEVVRLLPQASVLMGVPTHYTRLLKQEGFGTECCKNMRLFISGSAPLLAETFIEFAERTGHTILERYGMSETVMLVSNPYDPEIGPRLAGTVGVPLPGTEVRVMNDKQQLCEIGEIGAIQVRGPSIFAGYWQMPEKTKSEFTADGWFITGDMGRWGGETNGVEVPDHYLTIVGRSKDLIISGGFNVYPKEIEGYLNDYPEVNESAVIGLPHPDFGEAVVAFVVLADGQDVSAEDLQARMKLQIANFKAPKKIFIVPELPRNAMSKVQKNVLRQQVDEVFQFKF